MYKYLNEMSNLEQTQKQEQTQDEKEVQPLSRQHTRYEKPCILSLDYDLYVIKSGTTYKIISSITDKEVDIMIAKNVTADQIRYLSIPANSNNNDIDKIINFSLKNNNNSVRMEMQQNMTKTPGADIINTNKINEIVKLDLIKNY